MRAGLGSSTFNFVSFFLINDVAVTDTFCHFRFDFLEAAFLIEATDYFTVHSLVSLMLNLHLLIDFFKILAASV
jgi:hypothetical protein